MPQQGWISLHRSIQDHWLWNDKPFDKARAWIDILLTANHQGNKFLLGNELVEVERGSFITSELKLMDRWGWSKTKVRNFLELLEKDNMLIKKSDRKKTTLTVVNYSVYQESRNHEKTTKEPIKDHKETTKEPIKDTNNNVNNENNDNKYMDIFNFYIKLDIVKHKALTQAMIKAIDLAIKQNSYSVEDCKALLQKHKKVIVKTKDNQYAVKKRPLVEFFGQKIKDSTALICTQYEEGGKYDFIVNEVKVSDPNKPKITRRDDM